MRSEPISVQKILSIAFITFSVPAILFLFILSFITIQRQNDASTASYQNELSLYANTMDRALENTHNQLARLYTNNLAFQGFHYANSQLQKHLNAFETMRLLNILPTQEPLIGGFFLFSDPFSYYLPSFQQNYPLEDQKKIKDFLISGEYQNYPYGEWIPFSFSDRTVLLEFVGIDNTICMAMIDPSLDEAVAAASDQKADIHLFFASDEGIPYTSVSVMRQRAFVWTPSPIQKVSVNGSKYLLIKNSIVQTDMQLCYMLPYKGSLAMLNPFQKLLFCGILLLFCSIPFIWLVLYRQLLSPLHALRATMMEISKGNLARRFPENYFILELEDFSKIFNRMLDNIQNLKLQTYERKLNLQQARLQYLQLQIHPHFYLNCLKSLYGMAEKQQYKEIQKMILALSDYFRYMFRNNKQLVSLSEELHSVTCYINLQQMNFSCHPNLTMDIAADTADIKILPLSLLTFVENSIKHSTKLTDPQIHLTAHLVSVEAEQYLNLTVTDNSGGFSEEALKTLNHLPQYKSLYDNYHVGISNIYYRMQLTYNGRGMMAFYNIENGGCVELFIPTEVSHKNESINC